MDQQSISLLLWSFFGAGIGGALSAYLTGRFGEKGKIDATYAALLKVAKQVEVVTEKAETIKTQVAAGEWNRQWWFDRNTKTYGELLDITEKLITSRTQLMGYSEQRLKAGDPSKQPILSGTCAELSQALVNLNSEWRRITSQAMLVLDEPGLEILLEFEKASAAKIQDGLADKATIMGMQAVQSRLMEHGRSVLRTPSGQTISTGVANRG